MRSTSFLLQSLCRESGDDLRLVELRTALVGSRVVGCRDNMIGN